MAINFFCEFKDENSDITIGRCSKQNRSCMSYEKACHIRKKSQFDEMSMNQHFKIVEQNISLQNENRQLREKMAN